MKIETYINIGFRILLFIITLNSNLLYSQTTCTARKSIKYDDVYLFDFVMNDSKINLIGKNKILKSSEELLIIDISGIYAIVTLKLDTFAVEHQYLYSPCLNNYINHDSNSNLITDKQLYESNFNGLGIEIVHPQYVQVNKISKLQQFTGTEIKFLHSNDSVLFVGYKADSAIVFVNDKLYKTDLKSLVSKYTDSIIDRNKYIYELENKRKLSNKNTKSIQTSKLYKQKLIDKYGNLIGVQIFNKQISIGMTQEMVIESWGKPIDINRTITLNHIREQWVYGLKSYLYFENGILVTIQN